MSVLSIDAVVHIGLPCSSVCKPVWPIFLLAKIKHFWNRGSDNTTVENYERFCSHTRLWHSQKNADNGMQRSICTLAVGDSCNLIHFQLYIRNDTRIDYTSAWDKEKRKMSLKPRYPKKQQRVNEENNISKLSLSCQFCHHLLFMDENKHTIISLQEIVSWKWQTITCYECTAYERISKF